MPSYGAAGLGAHVLIKSSYAFVIMEAIPTIYALLVHPSASPDSAMNMGADSSHSGNLTKGKLLACWTNKAGLITGVLGVDLTLVPRQC